MKIGAVVLAAGSSSRLGQPKQLLQYQGKSLVRHAAEAALGAGCRPVAVVVGAGREEIAGALGDLALQLLPNDLWKHGIGTSIRAGVEALQDCDALILLACDQPHVDGALLRELIAAHQETQKPMVASTYADTVGVPALFARLCFEELLSLGDEQGAKSLLTARPDEVVRVDFPQGATDIDTLDDYQDLLR